MLEPLRLPCLGKSVCGSTPACYHFVFVMGRIAENKTLFCSKTFHCIHGNDH